MLTMDVISILFDHMTKLKNFTKEENCDFLAFRFSLPLMLEQSSTNLILSLMISQKLHIKIAQMNLHVAVDTR